jgi:hypothetical protein
VELERIQRALREGPLDEPTYVPGAFRRAGRTGWSLAITAMAVGVALVAGIAIGAGLGIWREDVGSRPEPRVLVAADLQGVWRADPIAFDAWTESLLSRGFTQADIEAFLEHDPFEDQAQYQLRFIDERLIVQASYDDRPLVTLNEGRFTVDEDGVARYVEVANGVEGNCVLTVAPEIEGSRLLMDVLDQSVCDSDAELANTLFFDIAMYERAED